MMAVKYKCRYCNEDTPNFDCSCEQKQRDKEMWYKNRHKINQEVYK